MGQQDPERASDQFVGSSTRVLRSLYVAAAHSKPSLLGLCLTQTRPVFGHLGLSSEQRTQLALLLGNEHTDHLPAHLRHAHPAYTGNTCQPDQHGRRHVKLHGKLTARTILGR